MYNQNDTVLYGSTGVCIIKEIVKKKICGKKQEYYVLDSIYQNNSTVFVPVDNEQLVDKMRKIVSADEIDEIIAEASTDKCAWEDDEKLRKEHYKEIIASANSWEIVKRIKSIYNHKRDLEENGKKLHIADERFLKDAEKIIYEEFALVLNIKPKQVLQFIQKKIESFS